MIKLLTVALIRTSHAASIFTTLFFAAAFALFCAFCGLAIVFEVCPFTYFSLVKRAGYLNDNSAEAETLLNLP